MKRSLIKKLWLGARASVGAPPLMEEQLGCEPDIYDARDYIKTYQLAASEDKYTLPLIRPRDVINQGRAGSCAGCAASHAVYILLNKADLKRLPSLRFMPSYLYIYYKTRELQGTVDEDSGSQLRNTMKVLSEGVCQLARHDYGDRWRTPPSRDAEEHAGYRIHRYERLKHEPYLEENIRKTLSVEKLPIIIGTRLYKEPMGYAGVTGDMRLPTGDDTYLGGHAMVITGYSGDKFQLLNSWGSSWGNSGYFWVPKEYVLSQHFTFDMWTFGKTYW